MPGSFTESRANLQMLLISLSQTATSGWTPSRHGIFFLSNSPSDLNEVGFLQQNKNWSGQWCHYLYPFTKYATEMSNESMKKKAARSK